MLPSKQNNLVRYILDISKISKIYLRNWDGGGGMYLCTSGRAFKKSRWELLS